MSDLSVVSSGLKDLGLSNEVDKKELFCEEHGSFEGFEMMCGRKLVESICPVCLEEESAEERKALHETIKSNSSKDLFNRSSIPKRYQKKGFGNFTPRCDKSQAVYDTLIGYLKDFESAVCEGTSFLFTGNTGTGKTHLACAIVHNVIDKGFTARYISLIDCLSLIKASWNSNEDTEDDVIDRLASFDLLVLDEIGQGKLTSVEHGLAFRVINRRYEDNKPTIGISKLNEKRVSLLIGDDSVSRLKSGGGGSLFFDWKDYRC